MTLLDRLFEVRNKIKLAIRIGLPVLSQRSLAALDRLASSIVRHDAPPPEQDYDSVYDLLDEAYVGLYNVLSSQKLDAVLPTEMIEKLRNQLSDLSSARDDAGKKEGRIRMMRRGMGGWSQ